MILDERVLGMTALMTRPDIEVEGVPDSVFTDSQHYHLAEPAEKAKALRGEPYKTLCGLVRPFLRRHVILPVDDPRACVLCTRIHDKVFL